MTEPIPDYEAIDEAIEAASTLELWLSMNKPIGPRSSHLRPKWLETIRDIRYYIRYLRDHPPEEEKPNEPF